MTSPPRPASTGFLPAHAVPDLATFNAADAAIGRLFQGEQVEPATPEQPIPATTDADEAVYQALLAEAEALVDTHAGKATAEGDRLDALVTWLVAYEDRHYPLG